jgi:hypothetical protein
MGVKANYKYSSSVKFMQVILNDKSEQVAAQPVESESTEKNQISGKTDEKKVKQQQEIERLMSKEELSNRDMIKLSALMNKEARADTADERSLEIKNNSRAVTLEKDAIRNDSSYWNTIRPIPLSAIENKLSDLADSTLSESHPVLPAADSTSKKKNPSKFKKAVNALTFGSGFWMFDTLLRVNYNGLIGLNEFDFNTVDGFIYRQSLSLEQQIDSAHRVKMSPGIAYAFNRDQLMWWTDISYNYAPLKGGSLKFHISSGSADYNNETGINQTVNSLASLLFRRNYLKLYQQNQAYLSNQIDLVNGLNLSVLLGYRTARPLVNHSDYSFFYRDERAYSANVAGDDPAWLARNVYNEEAYWDMRLEYTPRYYYRILNGVKHYQHSNYPTLYVRNKMAVPGIVNSTADYNLVEVGLKQSREWGMMHAFSWNFKAGKFLSTNKIFAMDHKYFNNQDLPVLVSDHTDAFRLLPYYRYNSTGEFAEAHLTFTTPYLIVKYLPFLSNKLWCENLHLNYLTGSNIPQYLEAGYSVSQIYLMGSVGVYAGFSDWKYKSVGVKISLDLE